MTKNTREIAKELDHLESQLAELKIQFEQYFLGIINRQPEDLHEEVKKEIRKLQRRPFRNSTDKFRLRMLSARYQTYKTYWERVMQDREAGNYQRDNFKASLKKKEKIKMNDKEKNSDLEKIKSLYSSYEKAIEKFGPIDGIQLSEKQFSNAILRYIADHKEQNSKEKTNVELKVKNGKLMLQIT